MAKRIRMAGPITLPPGPIDLGRTNATPGFAIKIEDDTDLRTGILVAEFGDGNYQPVAVVVSINEAREIAASDMRGRMRDLEAGKEPGCPDQYVVWAQGIGGDYRVAMRIATV